MQVAVVVGAPLLRIEGLPLRKAAVLRMPQHQMRNPQPLRQLAGILDGGVVLFVGFEALAVLIEAKRLLLSSMFENHFVFPIFLESFRMVPPRFWRGRIDSLYHITLFYHFFHKRKRNFF